MPCLSYHSNPRGLRLRRYGSPQDAWRALQADFSSALHRACIGLQPSDVSSIFCLSRLVSIQCLRADLGALVFLWHGGANHRACRHRTLVSAPGNSIFSLLLRMTLAESTGHLYALATTLESTVFPRTSSHSTVITSPSDSATLLN